MAQRPLTEQIIHDRIITLLSKTIFKYPNATRPSFRTITNHPLKTHSLRDIEGNLFSPDLIVIDTRIDKPVIIAEVETESSLNESEIEQWKKFSSLTDHFTFFYPRGFDILVKRLCAGVKVAKFYEYWEEGGKYKVSHTML